MKTLEKYLLIAFVIGIISFLAFNFTIEPNVFENPESPLTNYVFLILPIIFFIISLIYSIRTFDEGYVKSVMASLLIPIIYSLMFFYFGWNLASNDAEGRGFLFIFLVLISGILFLATLIINSIVYFVRKKK